MNEIKREAPLGYKIIFKFDMPDGSKNGGISSNPDALSSIWGLYHEYGGSNLVIEDLTFYKESTDE